MIKPRPKPCNLPEILTRAQGATLVVTKNTIATEAITQTCAVDVPVLAEEIEWLRSEVAYLRRREEHIITACERVADGGQYRTDIVSAIERIRRERDEWRNGFRAYDAAANVRPYDDALANTAGDLYDKLRALLPTKEPTR